MVFRGLFNRPWGKEHGTIAIDPDQPADVHFSVPATHRTRFTGDVLNRDRGVLVDVLEPSEGRPARVQFWVDERLAEARPDLPHKLCALADAYPARIVRAGRVQSVPGGEAVKNDVHVVERMLKVIHHADLDRRSYVVVVGGGAVLDAVGFAAAIAHRGIRLVRLPTTTLAQADSGMGVKNGVNLFGKKNWVGTFAVPWAVINDVALLDTLPDREFACGFSEAVKVALLKDSVLFDRIQRWAPRIRRRDPEAAMPVIREAAMWHLDHITRGGDPFEAEEARPLDYGHWSAHKLETMTDFQLRHGEAVAIGVAIDSVYSALAHGFPPDDADRVLHCMTELGLPLDHPVLRESDRIFEGLEEFRQHLGGRLTLTMLRRIGRPIHVHEIDRERMRRAIGRVTAFAEAHAPAADPPPR